MSSLLIKNGRVIDPKNKLDEVVDVFVQDGKISAIGKKLTNKPERTIDASRLVVAPGLIDMHVHMREPGREDQETLETASKAALAGGITTAVAMPNVNPIADNQTVVEFVINRSKELDLINIYPAGSITKRQEGSILAEINELKNSGAIAITDDGFDVQNEAVLKRAMEYAKTCGIMIMSHCETDDLTEDGVMHEGWTSTQLGLPGVPALSEDIAAYKNILLAEETGVRLHLMHISTLGSIRAINEARKRNTKNITAEVSVQHFSLTDSECMDYNTGAKMYPPLRSQEHLDAIIAGIKQDAIDVFTTDHAPQLESEKLRSFQDAPVGSVGLETSFAVMNTYLVIPKHINLSDGISKMTYKAADILNINKGTLSIGADADIAIFDISKEWIVDSSKFYSKGKNSVFNGKKLTGKTAYTIVGGKIKYENGQILAKPGTGRILS